jgi:hypothetical protein
MEKETKELLEKVDSFSKKKPFWLVYDDSYEREDTKRVKKGLTPLFYKENYENAKIIRQALEERYEAGETLSLIVVKEMQSGKTDDFKCFLVTCVRRDIIPVEERLFTTGDPDVALRKQAINDLGEQIRVEGIKKLLTRNEKNPFLEEIKLLCIDEDQFAQGQNSQVHKLYNEINDSERILIRITATPGGQSLFDHKIVRLKKGKGYRGISHFLASDQIRDLNILLEEGPSFQKNRNPYFYEEAGGNPYSVVPSLIIKPTFASLLTNLSNPSEFLGHPFKGGLAVATTSNPLELKRVVDGFAKKMRLDIEVEIASSVSAKREGSDREISESIEYATKGCMKKKNVLLLVEESCKAGLNYDSVIKELSEFEEAPDYKKIGNTPKNKLVFSIETREANANSILQGLPGRSFGYHENSSCVIYTHLEVCRLYRDYSEERITLQHYDSSISEVTRSSGRGRISPATHVKSVQTVSGGKTQTTSITLGWDSYEEDFKTQRFSIIRAGYDPDLVLEVLKKSICSNKSNFGKKGKTRVGKKQMVEGTNGEILHPTSVTLSSYSEKEKHKLMKMVSRAEDQEIYLESFYKKNLNTPDINVGLIFVDEMYNGEPKKIIICLKGDFIPRTETISHKDTTMYTKVDL